MDLTQEVMKIKKINTGCLFMNIDLWRLFSGELEKRYIFLHFRERDS